MRRLGCGAHLGTENLLYDLYAAEPGPAAEELEERRSRLNQKPLF